VPAVNWPQGVLRRRNGVQGGPVTGIRVVGWSRSR
jgi:hypothetical protein